MLSLFHLHTFQPNLQIVVSTFTQNVRIQANNQFCLPGQVLEAVAERAAVADGVVMQSPAVVEPYFLGLLS